MITIELHGEQATWDGERWTSSSVDLLTSLNVALPEFTYSDTMLDVDGLVGLDAAVIRALPFQVKVIKNKPQRVKEVKNGIY